MDQEINSTQLAADTQAETSDEILLVAVKLFAQKGYFNTSLGDIAEAAKLTEVSCIYQYFDNKQAIAAKIYEMIFDNLNVSVDDIRRRYQKASEQLRGIVDLFFKLTDDAPYVMDFLLNAKTGEFLPDHKPIYAMPAFIKILKIIQNGIRAGEIRNIDPTLVSAYFFGIIHNTLRLVLNGQLEKRADAYQAQTWLAAWNLIAKKSTCF